MLISREDITPKSPLNIQQFVISKFPPLFNYVNNSLFIPLFQYQITYNLNITSNKNAIWKK